MNRPHYSPEPSESRDRSLADAIDAITQQIALGQPIDPELLYAQYADVADQLRELLPIMSAVGQHIVATGNDEHNISSATQPSPPPTFAGTIGDFRILGELGRGGMGIVYEAEQVSLQRPVALKVLPFAALMRESQLKRFQNEARAAAMLKHPHIVCVHFVGCDRGINYYAMELIRGRSLAELHRTAPEAPASPGRIRPTDETRNEALSTHSSHDADRRSRYRWIARLGKQAAEALHYAHEQGVVHRDVKPSNLLLDNHGELYVTDFGLAQVQAGDELTLSGQLLGTLRYMSPEQLSDPALVDRRTDVYSLGATLYELIAGRPLFLDADRAQVIRAIREIEPPVLRKVNSDVPVDLATIVERAISKDRDYRYRSAGELAEDLQRFLDDRPILARPVGRLERVCRWCRRSPAFAGLLTAACLLSMSVATLAIVFAARESAHRRDAQSRAEEAEWQQYVSDMHSAMAAWEDADVGTTLTLLERHRSNNEGEDFRGFEWHYLWRQCHDDRLLSAINERSVVFSIAFSHNGQWLATGNSDGTARIWDAATGRLVQEFKEHYVTVARVAFSPDDKFLVGADRNLGEICFWDLELRRVKQIIQGPAIDIVSMLFSEDGSQLATSHEDHVVRIWDIGAAHQPREIRIDQSDPPNFVHLQSPWKSGKLWVGVQDGTLRQIDTNTGLESRRFDRREMHWTNDGVFAVAPGEEFLATGGRDGTIHQIDATTGVELATMSAQSSSIRSLAFAPTSPRLAWSDSRGQVVIWDLIQHQPSAILKGHGGDVRNIVYSMDGKRLCTSGGDFQLNIWNTDPVPAIEDVCRHRTNGLISLAISPNGQKMAVGAMGITGPRVSVWDVPTGKLKHEFFEPADWVWCVAFSPDGNELAAVAETGELCAWDLTTYARRYLQKTGVRDLWWVHYSREGSQIVTGQKHGGLRFHDRRTGAVLRTVNIERSRLWIPGLSPDGHTLAVGVEGGLVLLDFPSGTMIQTITCESAFNNAATFSRDGQYLAYCSGKRVYLFQTDGQPLGVLEHQNNIRSADFSLDGKILASSDMANQVHVWDVARREERVRLRGHDQWVPNVRFTPDGKTIVSASNDGTVRLWRSTPAP